MTDAKPLLCLDVDGVLNPYKASRRWLYKANYRRWNTTLEDGRTFGVWLNKGHGRLLRDLAKSAGLELVWCTTWEHQANQRIGPRIGLPELPVIAFGFNGERWKFRPVLEYAGGRPLAWLDDDFAIQHEHRDWFLEQRGDTPTLLQLIDPHHGLRQVDLDAVARWAASLRQGTARPS